MLKKTLIFSIFLITFVLIIQNSYCDTIYDEGIRILQEYIRIDTTNPPGNEMETAKFLKKILDKEGIENTIFDLGNNRANFIATLKGDGTKRPIILLHHMDVVSADSKYWSVPPFSGEIINGELYGRGAIDMKGKAIIDLMALINIKRMKFPLKRDIILLAVADEEENSIGARWIIEKKTELVKNAEFLLNEGGNIVKDNKNNIFYYEVSIGEKTPLWLTLTFTGNPGHGSIPIKDSSVNRAIKAANKILEYNQEFIFIPEIKNSIKRLLSEIDITKLPGYTKDFETSLKNKTFLEEISKIPDVNASLRNTISITSLKGSDKINTIPNEASISLDCRLLPGQDKDKFINKLKEIINDDTVQIKVEEYIKCLYSSADNDLIKAIETCAKKRNKDSILIPLIMLSSTDSSFFRVLGINAYGFEPYILTDTQKNLAHSNDERISVENIKFGIDLLTDILKEINR